MGGSPRRFSHESLQDAKTLKTLLNELAKGFGKGELALGDGAEELVLKSGGLMNLRVKAEREGGRCQVSLRVSWPDPDAPPPRRDAPRIEG